MSENKEIILNVQFEGDPIKTLAQLSNAVDNIKERQKQLGSVTASNRVEHEKLNLELRAARKEYNDAVKSVEALTNAEEKEIVTIDKLNARNRELRKEMRALDVNNAEHQKRRKQITAEIERNTQVIRENSDAYTVQKMNIGNYSQSVVQAFDQTGMLSSIMGDFAAAQQKAAAASKAVQAAVLSANGALGAMRLAIIATGIGALVVLLGSLVAWLGSTQEGIDFVNRKLAALKGALSAVIDTLANIGGEIIAQFSSVDAFLESMRKRAEGLQKAFKALLSADSKAFTDGLNQAVFAVEDMTDRFADMGREMRRRAIEAEAIAFATQKLRDLELKVNEEIAKGRRKAAEKRDLAMDENKTLAEREKLLKEAQEETNKAFNKEIKILKIKIKLKERELKLSNSLFEESKELSELNNQLEELRGKKASENRAAERQIISIHKTAASERKQALEAQIALEQQLTDLKLAQIKDEETRLIAIEEERAKRELAKIVGNGKVQQELRLAIEEDSQRKLQEIRDKFATDELQKEIDIAKKAVLDAEKNTREEIDARIRVINAERDKLLANDKLTEEQRLLILAEANNKVLDLENDFSQKIIDAEKKNQEEIDKINQAKKDFALEMDRQRVESAAASLDAIMGLLDEESEAFQLFKAVRKGIALSDIVVNLQQELSALAFAAAANPLNAVTAGAAGATQLAVGKALAIARAAAGAASVIKAERGAAFYSIGGKRHSQGGTKFYDESGRAVFEAEKGETLAILKRGAEKRLLPTLSAVNQSVGGRSLMQPYKLEQGGAFSIGNSGVGLPSSVDVANSIRAALMDLPTPVVKVTEINKAQTNERQVRVVAGL